MADMHAKVVLKTGGVIKVEGKPLPVIIRHGEQRVKCHECGSKKLSVLADVQQAGILETVCWEVVECRRCHHRFVVESTLPVGVLNDEERGS
jgi:DNA-directed RNA polymerase subunit RPC12/RpoP